MLVEDNYGYVEISIFCVFIFIYLILNYSWLLFIFNIDVGFLYII